MGLRLEYVLIFLIFLTFTLAMSAKINQQHVQRQQYDRELEFKHTTFIEVTTRKREGIAYAVYGIRKNGILTLEGLRYSDERIRKMTANKAYYEEKTIHLEGNVTLLHRKGLRFFTEKADYNKKNEILNVTAPFVAYMDKNEIYGKRLQYNMQTEEIVADHIKAIVMMAENGESMEGKEN